jgi:hypothetical protein
MAENLYCPRCAASFAVGTAFCRTCGLELGGVAKIVQGDDGEAPVRTVRPNFRLMTIGVAMFILSLVVGLVFGALKEFQLFDPRYGKAIFFAFVAVSMLTLGLGFVFPTRKFSKRKVADPDINVDRGTSPLPRSLPDTPAHAGTAFSSFDKRADEAELQPASVTERTTRNLD